MAVVQNQRVSAGVYRNPQGKLVRTASSGTAPAQNPAAKPPVTNPAQQPQTQTGRNPNEFVRVSAGMYRDTKTGKIVRGQSPDALAKSSSPKTTAPANTAAGDSGAVRVGSGQWKLADGRVVASAGRPRVGQFGAAPAPQAPTPEPSPEPTPGENPPDPTPDFSDGLRNFLMPTTDMANDPVHQNSLKRGEEALNRRLSANGLMGSGREFELARDMNTELETVSQNRYNEQRQENASRLANMMEGQANRNVNVDQNEWNRVLEAVKLQMEQNPAQFGQWGMNEANNIQGGINSSNKANTSGQFRSVSAGGGGAAPVRPVVNNAGSSDALMRMIEAQSKSRNADNTSGLINSIGQTIGSLGKYF